MVWRLPTFPHFLHEVPKVKFSFVNSISENFENLVYALLKHIRTSKNISAGLIIAEHNDFGGIFTYEAA